MFWHYVPTEAVQLGWFASILAVGTKGENVIIQILKKDEITGSNNANTGEGNITFNDRVVASLAWGLRSWLTVLRHHHPAGPAKHLPHVLETVSVKKRERKTHKYRIFTFDDWKRRLEPVAAMHGHTCKSTVQYSEACSLTTQRTALCTEYTNNNHQQPSNISPKNLKRSKVFNDINRTQHTHNGRSAL